MFTGVGGHEGEAHEGVLRSTGGRDDGIDEHAFVQRFLRNDKRLVGVAHIKGDDGRFGFANLKAGVTETLQGIAGNVPQALDALRLLLDDVQGFECSGSGCRGVAGAEDVGACIMAQPVDDAAVGGDESSAAMNPPMEASDLLKVPMMRSTSSASPKWSHTPRP